MQSFLADFFDRSGSRVRTYSSTGKERAKFRSKVRGAAPPTSWKAVPVMYQYYCTNSSSATGNKVALADHDAVTIAVTDSHFSFVPHSEFQESRNQWEFQSGTNEK